MSNVTYLATCLKLEIYQTSGISWKKAINTSLSSFAKVWRFYERWFDEDYIKDRLEVISSVSK